MDNEEIYLNTLGSTNFVNINRLFEAILKSDSPNNLTVSAYFSKIIISLIRINPDGLFSYVYSKGEFINFLIEHSEFHSYRDLLAKILNFEKSNSINNYECKFIKHRYILYQKILNKLLNLE